MNAEAANAAFAVGMASSGRSAFAWGGEGDRGETFENGIPVAHSLLPRCEVAILYSVSMF